MHSEGLSIVDPYTVDTLGDWDGGEENVSSFDPGSYNAVATISVLSVRSPLKISGLSLRVQTVPYPFLLDVLLGGQSYV